MSENVIEVQNLCKSYGDVKAVRDLSFCVKRGELFAFLGVNGAGKSTTISILCGQLREDHGEVTIRSFSDEEKLKDTRYLLGVVFQDSVLDRPLTVRRIFGAAEHCMGSPGQLLKKDCQN